MFENILNLERAKINKNVAACSPYREDFFEALKAELKERVDKKRYVHTLGVIEMSQILAETYNVDVKKARLAALIHDWDKGYNEHEIRQRIYDLGIEHLVPKYVIDNMPKVVHGTTAAFALGIEYPSISTDVLQAVINHTTAEFHMNGLDMVLYIADALDPSRNYPGYDFLAAQIGDLSLQDLFVKTYGEAIVAVVRKKKILHPRTCEIWNYHLNKYHARHANDLK